MALHITCSYPCTLQQHHKIHCIHCVHCFFIYLVRSKSNDNHSLKYILVQYNLYQFDGKIVEERVVLNDGHNRRAIFNGIWIPLGLRRIDLGIEPIVKSSLKSLCNTNPEVKYLLISRNTAEPRVKKIYVFYIGCIESLLGAAVLNVFVTCYHFKLLFRHFSFYRLFATSCLSLSLVYVNKAISISNCCNKNSIPRVYSANSNLFRR